MKNRILIVTLASLSVISYSVACGKKKKRSHAPTTVEEKVDVIENKGEEKPPVAPVPVEPKPEDQVKPEDKKPEDPTPVVLEADAFRKSLYGTWVECLDTSRKSGNIMIYSSVRFEFKFAEEYGNDFAYTRENFVGVGCSGQSNNYESFTYRFKVGKNQGSNVFDFDIIILDEIDQEAATMYTSAKMKDQKLLISLGATNGDGTLGDGDQPSTRYMFPAAQDGDKNLEAYILAKLP